MSEKNEIQYVEVTDESLKQVASIKSSHHIQYVEPSTEFSLIAVGYKSSLEDIPEVLRSKEVCAQAVKSDVLAIKDVPDFSNSYELCMDAITRSGNPRVTLDVVPETFKTGRLYYGVMQNISDYESVLSEGQIKEAFEYRDKQEEASKDRLASLGSNFGML